MAELCGVPTAAVAAATGVTPVSLPRVERRRRAESVERGLDVERLVRKCK
jgi:hypothetical protein